MDRGYILTNLLFRFYSFFGTIFLCVFVWHLLIKQSHFVPFAFILLFLWWEWLPSNRKIHELWMRHIKWMRKSAMWLRNSVDMNYHDNHKMTTFFHEILNEEKTCIIRLLHMHMRQLQLIQTKKLRRVTEGWRKSERDETQWWWQLATNTSFGAQAA